jgi:uncharacterized protein YbaA (DUF1428 family)
MNRYTDLCVASAPTKSIEAYRQHAEQFFSVWRYHGAITPRFGAMTDKFGVAWMVTLDPTA